MKLHVALRVNLGGGEQFTLHFKDPDARLLEGVKVYQLLKYVHEHLNANLA